MFIVIVTTISATVTRYARIDVMLVENSVLNPYPANVENMVSS